MDVEKREFPRLAVNVLTRMSCNFSTNMNSEVITTIDLSSCGLGFESKKIYPMFSKCTLSFKFEPSNIYVDVEGNVVRREFHQSSGSYRYGIKFNSSDNDRLLCLINVMSSNQKMIEESDLLKYLNNSKIGEVTRFFVDARNFVQGVLRAYNRHRLAEIDVQMCQEEIDGLCDEIVIRGSRLCSSIKDVVTVQKIKNVFRAITGNTIYKSKLFHRAIHKPNKYPLDFTMLQMLKDKEPLSEGVGYYLDKYFISNIRKELFCWQNEYIFDTVFNFVGKLEGDVNILKLGCGLCKDVEKFMLALGNIDKNISIELIDQDSESFEYMRSFVKSNSPKVDVKLRGEYIIDLIKNPEQNVISLNRQDIICSIGVSEYLPDLFLSRLIRFCFLALKPHGKLLFGFSNVKNYNHECFDWYCDWHLLFRDKGYANNIVREALKGAEYSLEIKEDEGVCFFVVDKK